ncbi:cytochrome c, 4 heme-binding sites [Geotalea daltonii FRC-32]|uniref:Cytochrome c, 4 heme-binding sites n=1 Tax=Geotalea daltonii (strain DSM 22248 / JCM 15807 / FRC-32) TaxID=316067 RepID=B9M6N8_GEODF|nr:cytochrome c3 family protein [Geotalea daltonii]ACM20098.1 cytochrome c, 4 heme-binding sites [Geotalea daltonii FRC-32]
MNLKIRAGIAALLVVASATFAYAGLVNYTEGTGVATSPHNMNLYLPIASGGTTSGDPNQQVCKFCHTPHSARSTGETGYNPLWNRNPVTQNFLPYNGLLKEDYMADPTYLDKALSLQAVIDPADMMDGPSRLCMSCHDGTTAIDSYAGKIGSFTPTAPEVVLAPLGDGHSGESGGNLMNDHPIGFSYKQVAANDSFIRPANVDIGWVPAADRKCTKIEELLYKADKLTCASCHDVHNTAARTAAKPLLRVKMDGSKLCLTCHDK